MAQTEKLVSVDTPPPRGSTDTEVTLAAVSRGPGTTATKVAAASRTKRWVPPTARENLDPTEIVFRKIRG